MRENDWSNVITCHVDDGAVYTWRYKNSVIGKHVLRPPALERRLPKAKTEKQKKEDQDVFGRKGKMPGQVVEFEMPERVKGAPKEHLRTVASSVCVTQCGNFGIVGYTCGRVDRYNLQVCVHICACVRATALFISGPAPLCVRLCVRLCVCAPMCAFISQCPEERSDCWHQS